MKITSPAFENGTSIPTKYAYEGVEGGQNVSLPFSWTDVPGNTKSFALSIVDPHPVAKNWVHWFVINIPKDAVGLAEGASGKSMPKGSKELFNTYGTKGYGGPEPPPGSGAHPYVVTLYALDVDSLGLTDKTMLPMFLKALEGRVVGTAKMTGYYER
jgi:Raf kinase inhibitor-like YbhB/YbcL family protein